MAGARDYYEVLGGSQVGQPGRDPAGLPQAGLGAPPRREQGPGGGGAFQGDRGGLRRAVGSGHPPPLRGVRVRFPPGAEGTGAGTRAWAGRGGRAAAGRARAGRGPGAGRARAGRGAGSPLVTRAYGSAPEPATMPGLVICSAGCSPARDDAAGGPGAGRRPGSRGRADGGGAAPRRPPHRHPLRPGRAAHPDRQYPGRGHRGAADTAGRPGRPGQRRRPVRRPLPTGADRWPPQVPGGTAGHPTSICRCPRGRRCSARPWPSTRPGATRR